MRQREEIFGLEDDLQLAFNVFDKEGNRYPQLYFSLRFIVLVNADSNQNSKEKIALKKSLFFIKKIEAIIFLFYISICFKTLHFSILIIICKKKIQEGFYFLK